MIYGLIGAALLQAALLFEAHCMAQESKLRSRATMHILLDGLMDGSIILDGCCAMRRSDITRMP